MVPSFPAPPGQPLSTAAVAGGVYDSTAGPAVPASSVGALSGPWYVEEQHYSSYHKRMPFSDMSDFFFDPSNVSLSGLTVKYSVARTDHLTLATLTFNKHLEYQNYPTSSFYQPQKLSLQANGYDGYGINYGTPVGYQFGTEATVTTTQPYILRREATASEIADTSWVQVSSTRTSNFGLNRQIGLGHGQLEWGTPFDNSIWDGNYIANLFIDKGDEYCLRSVSGFSVGNGRLTTPAAMAGGFTLAAEPSGIDYFRDIVNNVFDQVVVNYEYCLDGLEDTMRSRWYSDRPEDWALSNNYWYPVVCTHVIKNGFVNKYRIDWG